MCAAFQPHSGSFQLQRLPALAPAKCVCQSSSCAEILLRVRYNTKAYCHVRASGHVTGHDHAQVIVTLGSQGVVSQYLLCMQEMMRRRVLPTDVTERELAEAFNSSPGFAADLVQQCRRFRAVLQAADASMHAAPAGGAEIVRPPACSLCEHIKRSLCSAWLYSCSEFCADRPVGGYGWKFLRRTFLCRIGVT